VTGSKSKLAPNGPSRRSRTTFWSSTLRARLSGSAFSPDVAWQAELEASFPYVETEDQLVAVESVKHDMEQARPMDRLICGDVGYGKTEVALRAAFKAIMDGKQVAVLVPTTVWRNNTTPTSAAGWPLSQST